MTLSFFFTFMYYLTVQSFTDILSMIVMKKNVYFSKTMESLLEVLALRSIHIKHIQHMTIYYKILRIHLSKTTN